MAKPNYSFEKRQRERAKKQKKEEKLLARKSGANKSNEEPAEPTDVEGATEAAARAPQAGSKPVV